METTEAQYLNLCLRASLFCALYNALCRLKQRWQTQTPVSIWITALQVRRNLAEAPYPERMIDSLLEGMTPHDTLLVGMVLMYMLCAEEDWNESSHLKIRLSSMLLAYGKEYQEVYAEFYQSENEYEQMGNKVNPADYSHKEE